MREFKKSGPAFMFLIPTFFPSYWLNSNFFEVQNAEILKHDDQLKKSKAVSDCEQAMKAGVVRLVLVPSPC